MNYKKIETDILGRLLKEKKVVYQKTDKGYWIANADATVCAFIHNCFMFLNIENSKEAKSANIGRLAETIYDYYLAEPTGMSKLIHDIDCVELRNTETDVKVYIPKKNLKVFDENARLYVKEAHDIVLLQEGEIGTSVIGMICPVRND